VVVSAVKLHRQEYPCLVVQPFSLPLVLLHGWGTGSESWQPLIPHLQSISNLILLDLPGFGQSEKVADFNLECVIELVARELPEQCVIIGWSLGGMLAVQLAARYPHKVSRIVTLAANAKFVASRDYETAMSLAVNRRFTTGFAADSPATLKLFSGLLAQGDNNERTLLKQMRSLIKPEVINHNWLQALNLLADLDNRDVFAQLKQPGLHLLAEKDVLVPVSAAQSFETLNPQQKIVVVNCAAHALHWTQAVLVTKEIGEFLQASATREISALDKRQVASSFSRAATTYDSVASLQRRVGDELFKKLSINPTVDIVLDLGCGTGYFTPLLQQKFPQAHIVGVDIAEGMLQFARSHHSTQKNWLCSDAELLPFANNSVDVIYSNFALQWCGDLPALFAELRRILKPNGEVVFTTLGPATLYELKSAWEQVDNHIHVNQFHEQRELLNSLQQKGFSQVECEHVPEVMEFANLSDLTRSLKALGAQNVNSGRLTGLTGRKKIQAFKCAYENFRRHDMLPATYDVFYLKAKP
jgi:malonyl-CoA O-methyltransferase